MSEKQADDLEEIVQQEDEEEARLDPEEYEPDATVSGDTGTEFESTGEPARTPHDEAPDDEAGAS